MTPRSIPLISLIPLAAVLGAFVGCFNGADSRGLPCETNAQCGRGLDCIDGFCGGEPSDALCGNGVMDPGEECDDGEQNAADGACRPDCTPETCGDGAIGPTEVCDDGNTEDGDGCSASCVLESCGNGEIDEGEDCDDAGESATCNDDCTAAGCGDGKLNATAGESCDDGEESATCDDDCTSAQCGDMHVNAAAGEECDNEAPAAADDRECLSNCTVPLLWDDMEPDTPDPGWDHEKVSGDAMVTDSWAVTSRRPAGSSMRAWDTGLPAPSPGDIRLSTPALDLSGLDGETIELRFDHARVFSDCQKPAVAYEGAVIEVSVDGGAYEVIVPDDGYSGPVGDGLCTQNPLDGEQAFTLDANYTTETFDLSAYAGSTITVGFRAGWDCGNCPDDQSERGWFIDNVVVWKK